MRMRRVEQHADWIALVEPEGQFLSVPILKRLFPSGLEGIPKGLRQRLRDAAPKNDTPQSERDFWIDMLLRDVLAWGPQFVSGRGAAQYCVELPLYATRLTADAALIDPATQKPRVLVSRYPRGTDFSARIREDRWNASPIDRLTSLCQANAVRIGVLTDGENICVVWAPAKGVGGYATFDTVLFTEGQERSILQAFISLFGARRFFAVEEREQIEALFERSAEAQAEVTKDLGRQVRDAVELLVSSISEKNLARGGELLRGVPPLQVYEAAVTVMMRIVFLLFAEERGLLPLDDDLYATSYAASTLRAQLVEDAESDGDEPLRLRGAAWFRLLAIARVIYAGTHHDRLHLPAYGGRLFDPGRFPFLERFPIDDLTMLAILDAIQTLPIAEGGSKERRRLSFRTLDVEQIGHVYEGLLDHGADRIDETYVGLQANTDNDEVTLREIEDRARAAGSNAQPLVSFFAEQTGRSVNAVTRDLERGKSLVAGSDPEKRRLLRSACDNDEALMLRVAPYAYLLRNNLQQLPSVYAPESLIVRRTRARRDSGTEYTPRELAEEIVKYALEPLCYAPNLKPAEELLALKICDPAVGSGAFLVAACRYLADRVVEAWVAEGGEKAKVDRDDLTLEARRLVVDRCLYGVDKDAMAVDMAKLSLWLVTMARDRPFSFLDHSLREGDSLVGISSIDQLRYLHIDPEAGKAAHGKTNYYDVAALAEPLFERASSLRNELEALPTLSIRDAEEKKRLSDEADRVVGILRTLADGVVATAISTASESATKRDKAFQGFASLSSGALRQLTEADGAYAIERLRSRSDQNLNAGRPENAPPRKALHWPLAFPEVFGSSRQGFDAIIGNPPFMGGKKISGSFGSDYRQYLLMSIAEGRKGNADLVSYFFLRAAALATNIAFLASNSIAEGETRRVGLDALVEAKWRIVRAVKDRPWPGEASIHISQVWLSIHPELHPAILDDVLVGGITPSLTSSSRTDGKPFTLAENANLAFIGTYVLGMGFTMLPSEAAALIHKDARNARVLSPYLNANDLCSRPDVSASRWIVNFYDWPIEQAQQYAECFAHVEARVKAERQAKKGKDYQQAREKWWIHLRRSVALQAVSGQLERVIVMPRVSKVSLPLFVENKMIFSERLAVIAKDDFFTYGVVTSEVHRAWARVQGSTHVDRPVYNPSECFETFPFPRAPHAIAEAMAALEVCRTELMRDEHLGLTSLYNRVHDCAITEPRVAKVRELHVKLDRGVCDAYGWADLELGYGFHMTDEGKRWTMCEATRHEILDRLLELNHSRHREEIGRATVDGVDSIPGAGRKRGGRRETSLANNLQMGLMGDQGE